MMRKILVLIFITLALSTWLCADDFTIGTGTNNQNFVPLCGYSNYGWSKFFFTADELQAAGMSGTVQITKIAFYLISGTWENYVTDNQLVYFRYFYDSTYGSTAANYPGTSGFTQIYSGSVSWNGPGWTTITLSTPINFDSSWGMEILWENRDGSKTAGPPKFAYTSTSSNYRAVYKYSDTSFPTTSGTRVYTRPNIRFSSPVTDVPNPAVAMSPTNGATGVAIDSNIGWTSGGGDPTDYLFSLWKADPLVSYETNLVTTSTTYDPAFYFDYSTTYYWRVIPRNSFGPATDCPTWSFTTVADPAITTFPWTENFDGTSFPPNSNWQRKGGLLQDPVVLAGSGIWDQRNWLNISGTDKAAWIDIWGTVVHEWLITPLLNITDDSQSLVFDLAFLKYSQPPTGIPPALTGVDDRFAVLIGDGFTWSTANIVREWNNSGSQYVLNDLSPWGQKVVIPLTGHTGHLRIAFYGESSVTNADNDIMVNNLFVGQFVAQPVVSASYNYDLDACILSWEPVSSATSYDVYYADTPNGTWNLLDNTVTAGYVAGCFTDKRFYKVIAKKN